VSARAVSRRAHLSWLAPGECKFPAGADRCIWLVGKQSTNSNGRILVATSFPAEWSPSFDFFDYASSLPSLQIQGAYLRGLRRANKTRSGVVCLLRNSSNTRTCQWSSKFFGCHDLPIVAGFRGLTAESPKRYIPVRSGRSRRGGLSKSPNGSVGRIVPGNFGERGLTECEARSTASNVRAQGWSVSRPLSAIPIFHLRSMKP